MIVHLLNAFLFTSGTIGALEVELARSAAFGGKALLDMGAHGDGRAYCIPLS